MLDECQLQRFAPEAVLVAGHEPSARREALGDETVARLDVGVASISAVPALADILSGSAQVLLAAEYNQTSLELVETGEVEEQELSRVGEVFRSGQTLCSRQMELWPWWPMRSGSDWTQTQPLSASVHLIYIS